MKRKSLGILILLGFCFLTSCGKTATVTEKSTAADAVVEPTLEIVETITETEILAPISTFSDAVSASSSASELPKIKTIQDLYDALGVKFGMSSVSVEAAWGEPLIDARALPYYPIDSLPIVYDIPLTNQALYITYNKENIITGFSIECSFDGAENSAQNFAQQMEILCGSTPISQGPEDQPYLYYVYDVIPWHVAVSVVGLGEEQEDLTRGPMLGSITLTEQ